MASTYRSVREKKGKALSLWMYELLEAKEELEYQERLTVEAGCRGMGDIA
jgi:hypothetical protein